MTDEPQKCAVTVIVPVFNRMDLLIQTVASLKAQTLGSAEFILVDDRSESQVWDYLQLLPRSDPRFKVIQKPSPLARGCQVSRNLGLELSTAESVMFLDSDDLLAPTCLEERYSALVENPDADFIVARQAMFSGSLSQLHWVNVPKSNEADLDRFMDLTHPIDVPWVNGATLIRRRRLEEKGIRYRPEFEWEDVAFHFECLVSGLKPLRMRFPGPPDSFYRTHAGVRMGEGLFAAEGMRSAAHMIAWMCSRLKQSQEFTPSRRKKLSASLFQTCVLRSIDAEEFDLAKELIESASQSELPFTAGEARRVSLYREGRMTLRKYPRMRYYWDRFARRVLIPDMFPSGPSTYGTVAVDSADSRNSAHVLLPLLSG